MKSNNVGMVLRYFLHLHFNAVLIKIRPPEARLCWDFWPHMRWYYEECDSQQSTKQNSFKLKLSCRVVNMNRINICNVLNMMRQIHFTSYLPYHRWKKMEYLWTYLNCLMERSPGQIEWLQRLLKIKCRICNVKNKIIIMVIIWLVQIFHRSSSWINDQF